MIAFRLPSPKRTPRQQTKRPRFIPGLLIVKIKEDVVANVPDIRVATAAAIRAFKLPKAIMEPIQYLDRMKLIHEVIPIFARSTERTARRAVGGSAAVAFARSVRESENEDLQGINLLRLSPNADLAKLEKQMLGVRGIEYVHRVPARWLAEAKPEANAADPMVNRQWGLRAIRWFETAPLPDAINVKVAVLDTGVDRTHSDLRGRVTNYTHEGTSATDIIGHGTHVSGIIGANPNNQLGIAGICTSELHVWKIFGDTPAPDGEYYVDELLYQRALKASRNAGARVVNLSIGGTERSRTEELLFRRLIGSGATVVAAMGNEYAEGNPVEYPAAYQGIVAVGAINETSRRAHFSNTGRHIALSAPGTNILSTLPMKPSAARPKDQTKFAAWSGTSMATPHVTAAAALVIARHPDFSPQQVGERLKATATKLSAMAGKARTAEHGAGLLNLKDAVSLSL